MTINAPVFIVGCPRSGTSFLYHLLLSAGGFAEFRTQMNVFDVLEPIYGDLGLLKNKKQMMKEWLQSKAFHVSGLDAAEIEAEVLSKCHGAGDFLRIVMSMIARKQGLNRWIDSTPTNIPHMQRIVKEFPDARIVHIIRDGRDVALSLDKRGWSRPLPWDKNKSLLAAGIYWEWIVRKGRKLGATLSSNYMELRYEELVCDPGKSLARVSEFIQHDLDYQRILRASVGSVKDPLTSFKEDLNDGRFTPVGRWRDKFPPEQLAWFERLVGDYLQELGYALSGAVQLNHSFSAKKMRYAYGLFYELKQWAKVNTPLSRMMVSYSDILIDK
jgi:hypothetical protein